MDNNTVFSDRKAIISTFHFSEGFSVLSLNSSSPLQCPLGDFWFGSATSQIYLYLNSPMNSHCLCFSENNPLWIEAQWKQLASMTVTNPSLAHKSWSVLQVYKYCQMTSVQNAEQITLNNGQKYLIFIGKK